MKVAVVVWKIAVASIVTGSNYYVHAQQENNELCLGLNGENCYATADSKNELAQALSLDQVEGPDPMLQTMPGTNFKAYRRADISSFYQEPPGSRRETPPTFNGQAAKFVNMSPDRVTVYWIADDDTPRYHGNVGPWAAKGTASFPSHRFTMTKPMEPNNVLCKFTVARGTSVYFCNPFIVNDPTNPAQGQYQYPRRPMDDLREDFDRSFYESHMFNLDFGNRYKNFTGGSEWLTMYPRDPPRHKIWRADYFGHTHTIQTNETYFVKMPPAFPQLSIQAMRHPPDLSGFRDTANGPLNITIKALSCAPRAFEVPGFLSEAEADHILDVVAKRELKRSTTGSGETSGVRTSRTTWIPRNTDVVLNAIYRRAADVLRINEALFRRRDPGEEPSYHNMNPINEEIQIVHYNKKQEYTAHHDFGYPTGLPGTPSRSINIAFYLNSVPKGGQTSFPRWRNAEGGHSLDVTPEKGKALIFYMINPDGNLDDLSQHAALPVEEGEKWFANLWIHDPYKST